MAEDQLTPIQSFYNNSHILITGGTGFLGRILIEKLLKSCPTLSTIYLLIRNKKSKNLASRLDELFEDVIFTEMKKICPEFRQKIVGVEGEGGLPSLGLSDIDRQKLISKVNIVFHAAASVNFNENLKSAVANNVKITSSLIQLAKQMKNLKIFMHVSTCYSFCVLPLMKEEVYPSPMDSDTIIRMTDNLSQDIIDKLENGLLGQWPNTYTYTKAIAENIISKQGFDLPVAIFRPSIITSSYKEPIPAWSNNKNGASGVTAGISSGFLRVLHCDGKANANMVPVDMCVNSLIAAAWEVGSSFNKNSREIPVYQYESSNDQPINWCRYTQLNAINHLKYPSKETIWYYSFRLQKNRYIYLMLAFFLHIVPACIFDILLSLMGRKPKIMENYRKLHKFTDAISFFILRTFNYESDRIRNMIECMSEKDKEIFFCDLKKLDWDEYFREYVKGIRMYVMREDMSTLPDALRKHKRLEYQHKGLKMVLIFIAVSTILSGISGIYSFLHKINS